LVTEERVDRLQKKLDKHMVKLVELLARHEGLARIVEEHKTDHNSSKGVKTRYVKSLRNTNRLMDYEALKIQNVQDKIVHEQAIITAAATGAEIVEETVPVINTTEAINANNADAVILQQVLTQSIIDLETVIDKVNAGGSINTAIASVGEGSMDLSPVATAEDMKPSQYVLAVLV